MDVQWMDIQYPPLRRRALCVYICPSQKKIMTIHKIRPDVEDLIEAHIRHSKDFIVISIGDLGVEVGSTLRSESEVFYLELAKTLVMQDWLRDDESVES